VVGSQDAYFGRYRDIISNNNHPPIIEPAFLVDDAIATHDETTFPFSVKPSIHEDETGRSDGKLHDAPIEEEAKEVAWHARHDSVGHKEQPIVVDGPQKFSHSGLPP